MPKKKKITKKMKQISKLQEEIYWLSRKRDNLSDNHAKKHQK